MPIKFLYVCDLLEKLESLTVRDVPLFGPERYAVAEAAVRGWFKSHDSLIHAQGTDRVALLSTLLPERRTDRVYYLQDVGLVKVLGRSLGLGRERLQALNAWSPDSDEDLATLVYRLQSATDAGANLRPITVEDIDLILNKLASQCRFSDPTIYVKPNTGKNIRPEVILQPLLSRLSARELKWVIRLILKRYAPVEVDDRLVLRSYHPLLPRLLQFQSSLHAAIKVLDNPLITNVRSSDPLGYSAETLREISNVFLKPQLGVKIGRPDFVKARSIKHCLTTTGKSRWAIEPKYDGEYCQIHIDMNKGNKDWIQIFSKSGKDSTSDRRDLHAWVRAALRVGSPECKFKNRLILEGEMVVYSDKGQSIQDFDKIRKYVNRSGSAIGAAADSPRKSDEHLMIVFFDALLIDDEIVMSRPYEERRSRLRGLVDKYPGFCVTAEWGILDFGSCSTNRAIRKITRLFAKAIAIRCEGLILKPCDGPYFALDQKTIAGKVIKLKKDYIPGLGDTADFVIVGARKSASEMCKVNTRWTDFFIACIQNKDEVLRYQVRPKFKIMDVLTRPCIPVPDMEWICERGQFITETYKADGIQERFDILQDQGDPAMAVVFKKPFVVEVLGSSFDKPSMKSYYALRHARIIKVHQDRGMHDAVGFHELQEMARQAKRQPQDVQAEEVEWRKRLLASCVTRGQKGLSQQSDTTSTTRSPGSTATSPVKPTRSVPVPLIRVDTSELLPAEDSPLRQRSQRALNVASLPTPPPSSPLVPEPSSTAPAQATTSQKRKRGAASVEEAVPPNAGRHREAILQLPPSHRAIANEGLERLAQTVSSYTRALAEVSSNISPKSSRGLAASRDDDSHEVRSSQIQLVFEDEDEDVPRHDDLAATAVIHIRSSQLESSVLQKPSVDVCSSPQRLLDNNNETLTPKRARFSRALTRSSRLSFMMDKMELPSSSPIMAGIDLPTGHLDASPKLPLAVPDPGPVPTLNPLALSFHPSDHLITEHTASANLPDIVATSPTAPSSAAVRCHNRATLPHPQHHTIAHPFSSHIFYLCPCIRKTPYITEDLLPSLYSTTLTSGIFGVTNSLHYGPQIIPSLSMWQRDLRQGTPELATIAESQSYPNLQKAVLVESRRPVQTRRLVDKVVTDIELIRPIAENSEESGRSGETIQFWDWRVMEDIVLLLKQQKRKQIMQERLDKAIGKWYLGCVTWSARLECNIWKEAVENI